MIDTFQNSKFQRFFFLANAYPFKRYNTIFDLQTFVCFDRKYIPR
jgi:hypothetical protein